jgi:hypothetical protein
LDDLRDDTAGIGNVHVRQLVELARLGRRLRRGHGLHELVALRHHGDLVHGQNTIERLNRLAAREGRLRDECDLGLGQGLRAQNGATGKLLVKLEHVRKVGFLELD